MLQKRITFLLAGCLYAAAIAQEPDFWSRLNLTQKIVPKIETAYPGTKGISPQWNNSVSILLSANDLFPASYTTQHINQLFATSAQKRNDWQEQLAGTFTVSDSSDNVSHAPSWNTGVQACGHISKGLGLLLAFNYQQHITRQTNYLLVRSFSNPSAPPGYVQLDNERKNKSYSLFMGLQYQLSGKRVQPGVAAGYRLAFFRTDGFRFGLSDGILTEEIKNSVQQTRHGWEAQAFVKIFLVQGFYLSPFFAYGQSYQNAVLHAIQIGGGLGYQFDMGKK